MTDWKVLFGDITLVQGAAWLAAVVAFGVVVKKVWPWIAAAKDFLDDVRGEDARPGVPARPALMERLSRLEERSEKTGALVDSMSTSLTEVRHEVLPNTGTSLRDAADRTETKVDALAEDVATVHLKLDNDKRRIDRLTEIAAKNHPEEGTS